MSCYRLALLIFLIQVARGLSEVTASCEPGFSEQGYTFSVTRKVLERGRILGKVKFDSCSSAPRALFLPEDTRFRIISDGTVTVKRQITLHRGSTSFVLNAWDVGGKKHSVPIYVWNEQDQQEFSPDDPQEFSPDDQAGFLKSESKLKRQKRDWVIPPSIVSENQRGPFPKNIVKLASSNSNKHKVFYSLTGQGADTPPVGVFVIDKETGWVKVTRTLDREEIDKYIVLCHAVSVNGEKVEEPMEIVIRIIDQNDNAPVFTENIFSGSVKMGSRPGTPVMTVKATDRDDAIDTYNGVVTYSIIDQNPKEPSNQMFKINADTGLISVAATGLDYKKYPEYTLDIRATDLQGAGLRASAKAVIKITDPNDEPETDMSGGTESTLTTHVLNTAQGIPAKDLTLTLSKHNSATGKWVQLSRSITNEDGRCPAILRGEPITAGTYQLRFETEEYWKKMQQESFYPYVEIAFTIKDPKQKYHIPLLLSPFSYTTYRGS